MIKEEIVEKFNNLCFKRGMVFEPLSEYNEEERLEVVNTLKKSGFSVYKYPGSELKFQIYKL